MHVLRLIPPLLILFITIYTVLIPLVSHCKEIFALVCTAGVYLNDKVYTHRVGNMHIKIRTRARARAHAHSHKWELFPPAQSELSP